jgi:His/Glu/Gln/Arg/opine family amino acid ABC transporter permease subunit
MPDPTTIERPPVVKGRAAPLPLLIFAGGIAALVLVLGGVFFTQYLWASQNRAPSPSCAERMSGALPGEEEKLLKGGSAVCHIVDALKSDMQAGLLITGMVLGAGIVVAGFMLYKRMPNKRQRNHTIAGAILGIQAVVFGLVILKFRDGDVLIFARNFLNFTFLEGSMDGFLRGMKNTIILAFGGELLGIIIGLSLALLMISKHRTARAPAMAYINFFRGTPLIFQLIFFGFLFLLGFQWRDALFTQVILILGMNMGAYSAEVFRAGIQSVEKGQTEAARSLGLSYVKSMRYVIVPQAVRRVIPPLMNEFVILIKDTSLVAILGLSATQYEIFSFSRSFFSDSRNASIFLGTAAAYLAVTLPLIWIVNRVEKRLRSGLVGIAG